MQPGVVHVLQVVADTVRSCEPSRVGEPKSSVEGDGAAKSGSSEIGGDSWCGDAPSFRLGPLIVLVFLTSTQSGRSESDVLGFGSMLRDTGGEVEVVFFVTLMSLGEKDVPGERFLH